MDFGELKSLVKQIMASLDHKFLNELPYFKDSHPSSENIAWYVADMLRANLKHPGVRGFAGSRHGNRKMPAPPIQCPPHGLPRNRSPRDNNALRTKPPGTKTHPGTLRVPG